eukprot:8845267-Alexandrium_andersonii.AAC.1
MPLRPRLDALAAHGANGVRAPGDKRLLWDLDLGCRLATCQRESPSTMGSACCHPVAHATGRAPPLVPASPARRSLPT